jgi:hypothetical protein
VTAVVETASLARYDELFAVDIDAAFVPAAVAS